MKFHVLGSGSFGNCSYLETAHARILIDCGFSYRETSRRLAQIGKSPGSIDAIFITHEHSDHISGLESFACQHDVPVFATPFTQAAIRMIASRKINFKDLVIGAFQLLNFHHDFRVAAFTVPHLACQPVNFIFEDYHAPGEHYPPKPQKLAILTDLGSIPPAIVPYIIGTNILSIEANYDPELLAQDERPDSVKDRISSGMGHLSNVQAASILDHIQPERIILTHLSQTANTPLRALHAFKASKGNLYVSNQDAVSSVIS